MKAKVSELPAVAVGHRLLVKLEEVKNVTDGGIFLPDTTRDREQKAGQVGVIVSIGPSAWIDKGSPWASVGDRVAFGRYAGTEVPGHLEYRFLNDEDVLGVMSK